MPLVIGQYSILRATAGILLSLLIFTSPADSSESYSVSYCVPTECSVNPTVEGYNNDHLQKSLTAAYNSDYQQAVTEADQFIAEHAEAAAKMQSSLTEYPWATKEDIYSYRDLNDVSLALLIKGAALRNLDRLEESKQTYQELIDKYYYGQCSCPQGMFVKPVEEAAQRMDDFPGGKVHIQPSIAREISYPPTEPIEKKIRRLRSTGVLIKQLPKDQRVFVEAYVQAVNSHDPAQYKELFHPSIDSCINPSNQDYFDELFSDLDGSIPPDARFELVPFSNDITEASNKEDHTISTHVFRIIIVHSSPGDQSASTSERTIRAENGRYYFLASCPSEKDLKEFRLSQNQIAGYEIGHLKDPLRAQLIQLLKAGRKEDAYALYSKESKHNQIITKKVIDYVEWQEIKQHEPL